MWPYIQLWKGYSGYEQIRKVWFADVLYAKYEYLSKSGKTEKSIKLFIDSCWNENLYDVNLKGDFKMKKVKSLKALVLSLMLCLAMGTTAFASEVSTYVAFYSNLA